MVHLDIPIKENDFTHRNGRTARMDADGNAYLLVYQKEVLTGLLAADYGINAFDFGPFAGGIGVDHRVHQRGQKRQIKQNRYCRIFY